MIHRARALYRDMVDDEVGTNVFLPKEKLVDLFANDESTRSKLTHVSGFIFHAFSEPGSFEVALARMRIKSQAGLNMDEFLAFLNTAGMSMSKGHTPNTADLMAQQFDNNNTEAQSEFEQHEVTRRNERLARKKMMSTRELRTLLRPSSSRGPALRKPRHMTEPSPFGNNAVVQQNKRRRKKRPSTAGTRSLSKTPFGTQSVESQQSQRSQQSSMITPTLGSRRRPHTAGGSSVLRGPSTTAAEMVNINGAGVSAGGSAMSFSSGGDGGGGEVEMRTPGSGGMQGGMQGNSSIVDEYEWNRSQQYLMEASRRVPPSTTLMSRAIDQERKIRELSLIVLRLEARHRKEESGLADANNKLARLQGAMRSVSDNKSARSRPGTASSHRSSTTETTIKIAKAMSLTELSDTTVNNLLNQVKGVNEEEREEDGEEQYQNQDQRDADNSAATATAAAMELLESTIMKLQARNDQLLQSVNILRGSRGHKYNRPASSQRKDGRFKGKEAMAASLKREIEYSTSLESEVNARGEQFRRLEHKFKVLEKRETNLRKAAFFRKEKVKELEILVVSFEERDRLTNNQIQKYRAQIKSVASVERTMLNACDAMSTYFDRQSAQSEYEQIGTNDSALKAGIGELSKHVLNLESLVEKKNDEISNFEKKVRNLQGLVNQKVSEIRSLEHAHEMMADQLATMQEGGLENDGGGSIETVGSGADVESIISGGNDSVVDVSDVGDMVGTEEWEEAARIMFELLDLDHDGYITKTELMRAMTFMNQGSCEIKIALEKLPALKKQLTPKTYLQTISDMFHDGSSQIDLNHYLRYLSMCMRIQQVPGARFHENHHLLDPLHSHIQEKDKQRNEEEEKKKKEKEKEKQRQEEDVVERKRQEEEKKEDAWQGRERKKKVDRSERRTLSKRKQLEMFQTLMLEEMGDDPSHIVQATIRLRHVLSSATVIARASQRKFKDAVLRVMHECAAALNCERASLFIVDQENKKLCAYVGSTESILLDIGKGIAGACATTNTTIIVNDVTEDSRFNPASDKVSGFTTRNILAVPGHDEKGRCTVVLEVINRFGPGNFTTLDEILLEVIADISGCFVSHASTNRELDLALRQRKQVMATVPSLWGGFLKMSRTSFMQSIEDTVRKVVSATVVCIYMKRKESEEEESKNQSMQSLDLHRHPIRSYRPVKEMIHEHHHSGQWREHDITWKEDSIMELGQGVVANCMRTGAPRWIEDCYNCLDYNPLVDMDVQGMACVLQPVIKKGIVIAVIQAVFPTLRTKDIEMLQEMSEQLPPLFDALNVIDELNGRSIMQHSLAVKKATVQIQSILRGRIQRKRAAAVKKSAALSKKSVLGGRRLQRMASLEHGGEKMSVGLMRSLGIEEELVKSVEVVESVEVDEGSVR